MTSSSLLYLSRRYTPLVLGPALLLMTLVVAPPAGFSIAAWHCAGLALWMALWWATEAIPLPATALLPLLVAPLVGLSPLTPVAQSYAHPIVLLFMGGFILGLAMQRWELHRRLALLILSRVGGKPEAQIGGFMLATAFLSMWVSNTATAVMMLPIALSVLAVLPDDQSPARRRFGHVLLLAIAYSANIGGIATLIGTPPNAMLAAYLAANHQIELGFLQWMTLGLPLTVVLLAICWKQLCAGGFAGLGEGVGGAEFGRMLSALGPASRAQRRVLWVFISTALAWVLRPVYSDLLPGISDTGIALAAALALFVIPAGESKRPLLTWPEAEGLPWGVLLLFGGGLALAGLISESGLSDWIAIQFGALAGWPELLLVLCLVLLMVFLTELTSNTATTAAFLPLLGALAVATDVSPLLLCTAAAIAASCAFMMPVATPPNAVVFGSGELPIRVMMKHGLYLNLSVTLVLSLTVWVVAGLWWQP
ncbi:DASS family sodium-coupled anion symporter [Spongiibacter sp. KMU-166]|uniref:DASS family sodium-coupled anion symporter n=1 Tax=Spongiibacter thalassae TaxID=2721624 RepID=A0ABX1GH46_9GAMM|nr:DASS family sodium-coupled anion symporter [Spongiibacter thalassae]NKI18255.1 DASS family sodium-coupled anion symporter [Spongiibacter thalassae]